MSDACLSSSRHATKKHEFVRKACASKVPAFISDEAE